MRNVRGLHGMSLLESFGLTVFAILIVFDVQIIYI